MDRRRIYSVNDSIWPLESCVVIKINILRNVYLLYVFSIYHGTVALQLLYIVVSR